MNLATRRFLRGFADALQIMQASGVGNAMADLRDRA